ncbi:MAG: polysaccharide deacetylase family protein [Oscillospiraceae bacterium]|nr:polysaccharide deacetylase family protein [Oscillospiraceae bacterium]
MKTICKFIKRRRYICALALASLTAAAILAAVYAPAAITASAATRKLPVYCVQRDDKAVSLTFDAAWGAEDTQQLIDILTSYGARATFFVVGDWAERYPEAVAALHDAGMEVMTHSDDHAHFSSLSSEEIAANLKAGCDKVEDITGVRPTLFHCPYGEYDDHVIETVESLGLTAIQWDVDSLDWKGLSAEEISSRVLGGVSSGSIVLFHNAAEHTPEALPGIIESLLADGYKLIPVSELLLTGEYELDHTGRMCAKGTA